VKKLSSATDPLWYKDAIIYELHVRAFADSNGDGIGDFPGTALAPWTISRNLASRASGFCLSSPRRCAMTVTTFQITLT
jgi:hypothetical protein